MKQRRSAPSAGSSDAGDPPAVAPRFDVRGCIAGADWPAIPAPPGASLLALQFQFQQSERWDARRLRDAQLLQLRSLLTHAVVEVPWYAQRRVYAEALSAGLDERAFTALPVITRAEVQAAGLGFHAGKLPHGHGKRRQSRTTGSTGTPLDVETTDLTQLYACALMLRDHLWHGRDTSQKLAVIRGRVTQSRVAGWQPGTSDALRTGPMVLFDITNPMSAQVDWLLDENPGYLMTAAANARELARQFLRRGLSLPALKAVRVYGEMLGSDLRALVRAAWDVPVQDVYSAEECGAIALQCPQADGYHVMAESVLLEVLGDDGRACAPGEVGRVVVSTLQNFAMPLVRYHIGDYAEVGAVCVCGRGLPSLARILGRQRNMLTLPDGSFRWPRLPGKAWQPREVIRQFQVAQTAPDRLEIRLRATRALDDDEVRRLLGGLRESLDWAHRLDIIYKEQPMHRAGAKYEDFVNEIPQHATGDT